MATDGKLNYYLKYFHKFDVQFSNIIPNLRKKLSRLGGVFKLALSIQFVLKIINHINT